MNRLETPRLVLRALTQRDAPLLLDFDLRNRAFLAPWEPLRDEQYFTLARAQAAIRADARTARRDTGYRWHLFLNREPRRIVGSVALSNIVHGAFLSTHLGYRLDGESTGKGLMTEAVGEVLRQAFGTLGLHRVEANAMPRNAASRRVLARLGFVEEGLSRRYLRIAGVWEDHLRHVLLNRELE
jgi:ribosomal-protein-alanine N-acetyltransferase